MNTNSNIFINNQITLDNILYIADLPKDCSEEDMISFFKNYQITQAKIFHKPYNSYSYAYFQNSKWAEKARKELNGEFFISKNTKINKPIRISKYENKSNDSSDAFRKNLLVKNLDLNITAKEFYVMFEQFGEIKSSKLETNENGESKGYGYVYYYNLEDAEKAILMMNGKVVFGKSLIISPLIPSKTRENLVNNVYIKNFPKNFDESDLRRLFEVYGEISSIFITRDDYNISKGFGFVCFCNPIHAAMAIKDIKSKNLCFPGLQPIYVSLAMKKEERVEQLKKIENSQTFTFTARLLESDDDIVNELEFEKALRIFIKLIFMQEYRPKSIFVDFKNLSANVIIESKRDADEFIKKYNEFILYKIPKFTIMYDLSNMNNGKNVKMQYSVAPINPNNQKPFNIHNKPQNFHNVMPMNQPIMNNNFFKPNRMPINPQFNINPNMIYMNDPNNQLYNQNYNSMMNGFNNMTIMPNKIDYPAPIMISPNIIPPYNLQPKIHNERKPVEDQSQIEDTAALIYEIIETKYPDYAGKLTGMIVDLGLQEMKKLLSRRDQLDQLVDEAYDMLLKSR